MQLELQSKNVIFSDSSADTVMKGWTEHLTVTPNPSEILAKLALFDIESSPHSCTHEKGHYNSLCSACLNFVRIIAYCTDIAT